MKLTVQIQLLPDDFQKTLLLDTMSAFNAAASKAAEIGFGAGRFSRVTLHHLCYFKLRAQFGLSAQMAVRAIAKAAECFVRDKSYNPKFRSHGAMTLDDRLFAFKGIDRVSILTLQGRQRIPIIMGEYQRGRLNRLKGQADLVYRDGKFFLLCTADLPEDAPIKPKKFLGVDLGIVNIAATSDGETFTNDQIENVRGRYAKRRRLLAMKTALRFKRRTRKNARRAIKQTRGRESRFRRDMNHCISKRLVAKAKGTGRGIALEDLRGIRDRARFRRCQRARMSSWSFAQLRQFIEYKGKLVGIPVVAVDARNTSRSCSRCGHVSKSNRKSQAVFRCRACGFTAQADIQAAVNIAARAVVNRPIVTQRHSDLRVA